MSDKAVRVLCKVMDERVRQEALKLAGRFYRTCADTMSNGERLAVLAEEVGEVARAMQGDGDLEEELIQVAAVAVAWVEGLRT